ncbi:MAG: hypothetical protein OEW11_11200 [Nitrospirota bacterium]|nr:hypothetical protein [Nitrospirota bacterium]
MATIDTSPMGPATPGEKILAILKPIKKKHGEGIKPSRGEIMFMYSVLHFHAMNLAQSALSGDDHQGKELVANKSLYLAQNMAPIFKKIDQSKKLDWDEISWMLEEMTIIGEAYSQRAGTVGVVD